MDFLKKVNGLVLCLAVLLAVGCGGDDPEPVPENNQLTPKCQILQDSIPGTPGYNSTYFYDTQGKLILLKRTGGGNSWRHEIPEYDNAGKRIRSKIYDVYNKFNGIDSTLIFYNEYQYNLNGQISRITLFWPCPPICPVGTFTETNHKDFTYDDTGKLIEIAFYYFQQPAFPTGIQKYTYHSGNMIEERQFGNPDSVGNLQLTGFVEYSYDNMKNPRTGLKNHLDDELFNANNLVYDEHNVISRKYYDKDHTLKQVFTYMYQYNAEGYPIKATWSAGLEFFYKYNCQ
jgi:hypothetical protein